MLRPRPPGAAPAAPGCAVFVSAALADGATAAPPPAHTVLVLVPGSGSEGTEAVGVPPTRPPPHRHRGQMDHRDPQGVFAG